MSFFVGGHLFAVVNSFLSQALLIGHVWFDIWLVRSEPFVIHFGVP